jgi:hypothetical protein
LGLTALHALFRRHRRIALDTDVIDHDPVFERLEGLEALVLDQLVS